MPVISDIAVRIRAITAPFTGALKKAQGVVGGFMSGLMKLAAPIIGAFKAIGGAVFKLISLPFKILTGTLGKIGAVFAAVAGGGIALFIKKQFDIIDAVTKTSRALGVQVDFLEGMKLAGSQLGVSNDKIIKSLKKFTRTMGEAALNTGAGATVFRVWGKDVKKFQGLNVEDSFAAISKELKKIKDPTKQAAIAFQFFGRNGIEMLNIINAGKGSLADFRKESERLKGLFSKVDTAKVEAANDAIDKLKISLGGIGKTVSFILAPAVKFFADKFTNVFVAGRKKLEGFREAIQKFIVNAFVKLTPIVFQVGKTIVAVFNKVSSFLSGKGGTGWIDVILDGLFELMASAEFVANNLERTFGLMGDGIKIGIQILTTFVFNQFKKLLDFILDLPRIGLQMATKMAGAIANGVAKINMALGKLSLASISFEEFKKQVGEAFTPDKKDIDQARKTIELLSKHAEFFTGPKKENVDAFKKAFADLNAERKAFVAQRIRDAAKEAGKTKEEIEALFAGIGMEGLGDNIANDVEDAVSKVKLEPKLALKGSQEAAKIANGQRRMDEKIVDNTKDTADHTKKMAEAMLGFLKGTHTAGGNTVDAFSPAVIK